MTLLEVNVILKTYIKIFVTMAAITMVNDRAQVEQLSSEVSSQKHLLVALPPLL